MVSGSSTNFDPAVAVITPMVTIIDASVGAMYWEVGNGVTVGCEAVGEPPAPQAARARTKILTVKNLPMSLNCSFIVTTVATVCGQDQVPPGGHRQQMRS